MECLAPLAIGLGVTARAVCRAQEHVCRNEVVTLRCNISRRRKFILTEPEIVSFADLGGICRALTRPVLLRPPCRWRENETYEDSHCPKLLPSFEPHGSPLRGVYGDQYTS